MVMDGQMMEIGPLMTPNNGKIVMATDMVMNITLKLSTHSFTSTKEVMLFLTIQLNGMIQIVMDGATTMLTKLGTSLEIQHGQARLFLVPPKLTSFL